jgi:hypothetical protein
MHTHLHIYIYTCIHTYIFTYIHAYTLTYLHAHNAHTCINLIHVKKNIETV